MANFYNSIFSTQQNLPDIGAEDCNHPPGTDSESTCSTPTVQDDKRYQGRINYIILDDQRYIFVFKMNIICNDINEKPIFVNI